MPGFELTERERKLLRLALDSSAQPGEVATSAHKLVESWRARGVQSALVETALEDGSNGAEPAIQMSKPDYGLNVMPFGRHKGEMFMDIPPYDLRLKRRLPKLDSALDRGGAGSSHQVQRPREGIRQFLQQT